MIISSGLAQDAQEDEFVEEAEMSLGLPEAAHQIIRHEFAIGAAHHGERLDRVLSQLLPDCSRSFLQQLVDSGDVLLGGQIAAKPAQKLKAGQTLIVHQCPLPQDSAFTPDAQVASRLCVVYEDAHLLVIDKAAGLVVHPAAGNWSGTLLNGLLARHECHSLLPRAGIVHRLDKDTSGLMVVARTREAMDALIAMIAAREVKRQYLALAHYPWQGISPRRVDAPMGRDPRQRQRMAVVDLAQYPGKEAQTDFELLGNSSIGSSVENRVFNSLQKNELLPHVIPGLEAEKASKNRHFELSADGFCLLRCHLHTGRTHQIRVHAAHVHHPLVADALYGGRVAGGLERQGLHAERLSFEHPITQQMLDFHAPLPADLRGACKNLGIEADELLGLDYNSL